jgi:hypothetical protein
MNHEEVTFNDRKMKANPFRVPEGYFEQLPSQVMSKLPDRTVRARRAPLRRLLYAAASVVVALVIGATAYFQLQSHDEQDLTASAETYTYMDEAADYAMLDNIEIYACLAEN